MNALIVVESMGGCTFAIAEAVAAELGARVAPASELSAIPDGIELVLVGAPTHHMTLPSPASRAQAAQRLGRPVAQVGVAEFIDGCPSTRARFVTFDTSVKGGTMFGRASKAAAKRLRKRGFDAEVGETFWVKEERLLDGEIDRARAWAATLR